MKIKHPTPNVQALLAVAFITGTCLAGAAVPSEAESQRILDALPNTASVQPGQPRKVLVFSRAWGYKHSSIPYGRKTFELMGRKTGAFEAVLTDDLTLFEADRLAQFDAIIFNNTNNELFLPEDVAKLSPEELDAAEKTDARLKKNLREFIASGKGLAVIHAGVASFRKWPEFGAIMGARFDNHPWGAGSTVTLKVEEPGHPVTCCFDHDRFQITDEIYQFKGGYSRSNLRVLLSVDTERTDLRKVQGIHRQDNDFALSWVKHYGRGRVFYCALGHQHDIFWNPAVLRHYLDGIQFAIGDLAADAAPSGPRQTQ